MIYESKTTNNLLNRILFKISLFFEHFETKNFLINSILLAISYYTMKHILRTLPIQILCYEKQNMIIKIKIILRG